MRVIAGQAKGRRLKAPAGWATRPITDRIKEALFNVLQTQVVGADFLDLYAGSGSVGIEALSRGANGAVFVEADRQAAGVIEANLAGCNLEGEVIRNDVFNALNRLALQNRKFHMIYADPPFNQEVLFEKTLKHLDQTNLLHPDGLVIIRVPRNAELPQGFNRLNLMRRNDYGESSLYYYCRDEEEV